MEAGIASEVKPSTWLEARRLGITSTDAPAILRCSPFKGPWTVYQDKLGELFDFEVTDRMERGTRLEPFILAEYARKTSRNVEPADEFAWHLATDASAERYVHEGGSRTLLVNRDRPWLRATPDAVASDPELGWGIIEAKTANHYVLGHWKGGEPPVGYRFQLLHSILVSGLKWGALVCLGGDFELYTYEMRRDEKRCADLLAFEDRWWKSHVLARIPPQPTALDLGKVKEKFHGKDESTNVLAPALAAVDRSYLDWKKIQDQADAKVSECEAAIRVSLGDHRSGQIKNTPIVYSLTPSGRLRREERKPKGRRR